MNKNEIKWHCCQTIAVIINFLFYRARDCETLSPPYSYLSCGITYKNGRGCIILTQADVLFENISLPSVILRIVWYIQLSEVEEDKWAFFQIFALTLKVEFIQNLRLDRIIGLLRV